MPYTIGPLRDAQDPTQPDQSRQKYRIAPLNQGPSSDEGFLSHLWRNLKEHGNLLGRENALETSAKISGDFMSRLKAGEKPGQAMRESGSLSNPMVSAFGVGNIGPKAPMMRPNPAAAERLADFEAQGITPSVPTIGQGRAAGMAAQTGRVLPFSPVTRGITQNLRETAGAAERAASQYGQAESPFAAGNVASNALSRFAADTSQADKNYSEFYRLMHGAQPAPIPRTTQALRDITTRFPNAPELSGILTNPMLSRVQEAVKGQGQGGPALPALEMRELRELRTHVGDNMGAKLPMPGSVPEGHMKRLYAALSADMYDAAKAQSPAAARALTKANTEYGVRMRSLERLKPLLSADAPESVFNRLNAASRDSASANTKLLQAAKQNMRPDEWNDVGAAIIRRLGNPSPGKAKVSGEPDFSIASYATNWNKLSPRAKDMLFGPDQPGSPRAGLEQLSRVVNAQKSVSELANVSHTAEYAKMASIISGVAGAIASGHPEIAAAIGGGAAGSYAVSKVLMSPGFTKWLYELPTIAAQPGGGSMAVKSLGAALRSATGQEAGREASDRSQRPPVAYPWQPQN